MFQHTAARRRLARTRRIPRPRRGVSTHSRPKAAGQLKFAAGVLTPVSTHSRPKAAGRDLYVLRYLSLVSTHSRPKAAGAVGGACGFLFEFQHTAARRRLVDFAVHHALPKSVSTHSRPKAAGQRAFGGANKRHVSTHSRPKAAGARCQPPIWPTTFQHTAARRRLEPLSKVLLHQV